MKSLFLYLNISHKPKLADSHGLYQFNSGDLVGIDTEVTDREDRGRMVRDLALREFFIIQPWFKQLIARGANLEITLTGIDLKGDLEEEDYIEIEKLIRFQDNSKLLSLITNLNTDGEHDIDLLSFIFRGEVFTVTAKGILETYADDATLGQLLTYPNVWRVLMGGAMNERNIK